MKPYYDEGGITIYHADCRDVLPTIAWDTLVTDPPYFGREDLFATDAVSDAIEAGLDADRQGLVFWPCLSPYPARTPDAVHIWHKAIPIHPRSVIGNVPGHHYERILSYGFGTKCEVYRVAAIMSNFAACRTEFAEHPTQKPLELMRRLMLPVSGVVLDPFAGSGSTLRAAKDLGHRAVGIEIEERYCEIAAKRLAQEVLALSTVASAVSPELGEGSEGNG